MNYLGQRNYPGVMLGKSGYSMARWGCTTVSLTMLYNWFYNTNVLPVWIASKLSYNANGELIWASLKNIDLELVSRIRFRNEGAIIEAIKNPKEGCLIQVQNDHWVLALSSSIFGGYNIADPWTGKKSTTRSYKNDITGCAVIKRLK